MCMSIFSKVALTLYWGMVFYFLMNLFIGPFGMVEYKRLLSTKNELEQHVTKLENINHQLQIDLVSIRDNEQELLIRARELGYYKANEGIIIVDSKEGGAFLKSPGFEKKTEIVPLNNNLIPAFFSMIFAVAVFVGSLVLEKKKNGYQQEDVKQFVSQQEISYAKSAHYSSV